MSGLRERFRLWLHRECRLERSNASALISVGEQLAALSGGMLLMRQALERAPEWVTVIAFGARDYAHSHISASGEAPAPEATPAIIDSKTVRLWADKTETVELITHFPVAAFQVVVLANLDRVALRGVFLRTDLIGMESPIAFAKGWRPGEQVRAIVQKREKGFGQ